jgi:glutathione S-transferase
LACEGSAVRRLVTIPISPFCEKARWALDRAGLAYREERHVQGVSVVAALRAGRSLTTPVLVAADGVFGESEDIVRYADRALPEAERLFPRDRAMLADVEALSRRFDTELGRQTRRIAYAGLLRVKGLALETNNRGVPGWEARLLRATWPVATRAVAVRVGLDRTPVAEDERQVRRVLDEVAERLGEGGPYLGGERFTVADLTFAALVAPVVLPREYGVRLPDVDGLPARYAAFVRECRAHPAGAYALRLFENERSRRY